MKRLGTIGLIGILLCGCDDSEKKQHDQVNNFAERCGIRETLRFNRERLPIYRDIVETCRGRVRRAESPNDLALAEDDLREARKELERIEKEIEDGSRKLRELSSK